MNFSFHFSILFQCSSSLKVYQSCSRKIVWPCRLCVVSPHPLFGAKNYIKVNFLKSCHVSWSRFCATSCEFNFNIWCTTVLSLLGTQFGCWSSSWSGRKQISRGSKMKRGLWLHVNLWVDDTKTEFTALISICHRSALTKCNHLWHFHYSFFAVLFM